MFEHSCCYCNSQKNLLNAFLHDVRCFMYGQQQQQHRHNTMLATVFFVAQRTFVCWLVSSSCVHGIAFYVWAVSSCTTLLLVIGRREIRFLHRKRSCSQSVKLLVWYCFELADTNKEELAEEEKRWRMLVLALSWLAIEWCGFGL